MTILAAIAADRSARTTDLDRLRAALRADFLAEAGWDPATGVLAPSRDHPLLGLRECAVIGCSAGVRSAQLLLCKTCEGRFRRRGGDLDAFCQTRSSKRNRGERLCVVPGCERPNHVSDGLCYAHYHHRRKQPGLTVEDWIAANGVTGLPSFGDCRVASCICRAATRLVLCGPHSTRWRQHRREHPGAGLTAWAARAEPVGIDHIVILKGLPEQVQMELLVALQHRTDEHIRTFVTVLRAVVTLARRHSSACLSELLEVPIERSRHDVISMVRGMTAAVRRTLSNPDEEQTRDVWDLVLFGLRGCLDFTPISQPWLREAAKHWASEDLPLHRGRQASATARSVLTALTHLSESLRLSRDDAGDEPAGLGRRDIVAFTNRLAHKERSGQMSANTRLNSCRRVRRFLDDIRAFGLTRPGEPLESLPADFVIRPGDVPADASTTTPKARDLPAPVLRTINDHLHLLEARSGRAERRIAELLIDTGRRPDEICRLPWDCLDRDATGNAVLIYIDYKNNRPDRRLPISNDTAQVVTAQKDEVRRAFPDTELDNLALFPRDTANRHGTKPIREDSFSDAHRRFIDQIAGQLVDDDGQPFNRGAVVPYAYRHSYAQRHADTGVPPDVLRDLMGHRSMQTTLTYYK